MTLENTRPTAPVNYDADARTLTQALVGHWHGDYRYAPCPVGQADQRRDQNTLTVADGDNGLLVPHRKESSFCFADILAAAGVTPGAYAPPDPATLAQRRADEPEQAAKEVRQAKHCWHSSFERFPESVTLMEGGKGCALHRTFSRLVGSGQPNAPRAGSGR